MLRFLDSRFRAGTLVFILLLITGVITSCGTPTQQAAIQQAAASSETKENVTLTVSAAASLKGSLEEIAPLFEKEHRNIRLTMNFGASGSLQKQIEQGAPVDLFLSAGQKQMNALIDKGLIKPESKMDLLCNRLVLVLPADASGKLASLADLKNANFGTIALGEPEVVPAGAYTREALEHNGLWESLSPKMVFAKDVTQVLTYVESGNVDAGFVYESDAKGSPNIKTGLVVDEKSHAPILYPAGVVTASEFQEEAGQFLQFLQTREARQVFMDHGFTVPE
ncbi:MULTISPECIES: molybdate ABC transporter substrate-binding protein [Paenibacillus]|uniref:molybdate ABC transporter substrate-binding protein n=1 Tax=Paenibacillus TaxID=44249 RepID=UPI002FE16792